MNNNPLKTALERHKNPVLPSEPAAVSPPRGKSPLHVVLALDASGSMMNVQAEVKQALADFVREQPENATANVVTFASKAEVGGVGPISLLSNLPYNPGGMTALYDGVALAIISQMRSTGLAERVMLVIVTDGKENASHEWRAPELKTLLKLVENLGWGVVFLGAGLDAFAEGQDNLGITAGSTYAAATARTMAADMSQVLRRAASSYVATGIVDLGGKQGDLVPRGENPLDLTRGRWIKRDDQ